ncbi:sulfite exporter TauE/SafE family protein [Ralstonia mannitolilytica]|uniref:Probable membrane transporter protein n=1 Tax=Ralstonia mannitolilytica TaxID=105219 RepID=A0AAJ4ZMH2_9RALS|nr:TSUP family transporter [Ralstonia mannitolilytica]AJW46023.1 transporter [Ralstonia mannitolilytica]MBU9577840.1 TSUP family transporter [Ralstonia mannitolilytica]QIF08248.1 sulfite exporter TauE/SafE family protein [Ralstonia mannitolilytica]CAG2144392.1 putative membrane transporter protein YfcA [Ralstonia mannitolilytica]CAJ0723858.1 putative membrane transporter protein YfcA [Ralstonia mannitolilytica]
MTTLSFSTALLVAAAGVYAGAQNALAGGGSFITFPALLLAGLNPLAANMTSTIALFPSQITSSIAGRKLAGGVDAGAHHLSLKQLIVISLIGGVLGALLLLATPPSFFAKLVPYLVLFATTVFAWGSFRRKPLHATAGMSTTTLAAIQFAIAIYGGYFGGGIGFLMLAALTVAGQQVRTAGATKNVLAMTMNASAVAVFAFSPRVDWAAVLALAIGGIAGGFAGAWLLHRLPEKVLRGFVVVVGAVLTVWLFVRA